MAATEFALGAEAVQSGLNVPPRIIKTADPGKARKVAEDFEAFFLSQMLQPLFADLNTEAPFGGGPGEEVWRSLQVSEYGKGIAKSGGIGIADMVYAEILKSQEV